MIYNSVLVMVKFIHLCSDDLGWVDDAGKPGQVLMSENPAFPPSRRPVVILSLLAGLVG